MKVRADGVPVDLRTGNLAADGAALFPVLNAARDQVLPPAAGTRPETVSAACLSYDDRYRRRTTLRDRDGGEFLLDLEKPACWSMAKAWAWKAAA